MSLLALRAILNQQGASWSPLSISGCTLWLDASDASTFTFSSGTTVSQWDDKSDSGYHVAQSTGADQPDRSATLNGLSVVTFAGSGDKLTRASSPINNSSNGQWSVFAVAKPSALSGDLGIVGHDDGDHRIGQLIRHGGSTAQTIAFGTPFSVYQDNGSSLSTGTAYYLASIRTSSTIEMFVNGSSGGSTSAANPNAYNAAVDLSIAYVGSISGSSSTFAGDIAEVIAYNTALSSDDRGTVEEYLATKWGL